MIVGRVDVLSNNKVFGWAFNPDNPGERLQIRISRGAGIVATGRADVFREDLPDSGVGDGRHAFEIELPPNITSLQGLVLVARSESAGETTLQVATHEEHRFDDLFNVFSIRYDDLLVELKGEIDALKSERGGAGASLPSAELEERLSKIERRLEDFEVFIMRIDEMTRTLQERVGLRKPKSIFARLFG